MDELQLDVVLKTLKTAFVTIMRKIDLDSSELVKKTNFTIKDDTIQLQMFDYAEFVDKGRRKGRQPPTKDILMWMNEKGIRAPQGTTQEGLAFAIARSISKNGVKPKPFIEVVAEEMQTILSNYIFDKINDKLIKILK